MPLEHPVEGSIPSRAAFLLSRGAMAARRTVNAMVAGSSPAETAEMEVGQATNLAAVHVMIHGT